MDKFTVRDSAGCVDVVSSVAAYERALTSWVQVNEVPLDLIESAVEAAFDSSDRARLPIDYLTSVAVQNMGVHPDQYRAVTARVGTYIRGQASASCGRLEITKGTGGGVARLSRPGEPVPARPVKS